jgi:arabinose-5-phosphate isomerase
MVLLEAHSFKLEDYALRHPGGAIGRTLLLHVSDIMRTGEKVAHIHTNAPVRDALIAMTSAKSGSVAILDSSDRLVGILTDGDLRRHLLETPQLLDLPVEEIMSSNPLTLRPEMLAAEVLKLYENNPVDDLIVVDEDRRVVGSVDIQDMPRLKVL